MSTKATVTLTIEGVDVERLLAALQKAVKPKARVFIKFGPVSERSKPQGENA